MESEIKLEAGKYYITRDGKTVGPARRTDGDLAAVFPFTIRVYETDLTFTENGRSQFNLEPWSKDVIKEAPMQNSKDQEIRNIKQKIENIRTINESAIAELNKLLVEAEKKPTIKHGDYGYINTGLPGANTRRVFLEDELKSLTAYSATGKVGTMEDPWIFVPNYTITGNLFE